MRSRWPKSTPGTRLSIKMDEEQNGSCVTLFKPVHSSLLANKKNQERERDREIVRERERENACVHAHVGGGSALSL